MHHPDADNTTQRPGSKDGTSGPSARGGPAFLFDLDGTLVDSVYQHVLAWREAKEVAR